MKQPQLAALIAAGRISESALARTPGLNRLVGPVLAPSARLTSRFSALFPNGRPVAGALEFDTSRVILLAVPPWDLPAQLEKLRSSALNLRGRTVVLIDPVLDSSALSALQPAGAHLASLGPVHLFDTSLYAMEGDRLALRELHRYTRAAAMVPIELDPGAKPAFLAAVALATALLVPHLDAAARVLRCIGVNRRQSEFLLHRLTERAVQEYNTSARRSWQVLLPAGVPDPAVLAEIDPQAARLLARALAAAAEYLAEPGCGAPPSLHAEAAATGGRAAT